MKKKNLKSLHLNKKQISTFVYGGNSLEEFGEKSERRTNCEFCAQTNQPTCISQAEETHCCIPS